VRTNAQGAGLTHRRTPHADVERGTGARMRAGKVPMTETRRKSVTLSEVWRVFWRHPSPWLIGGTLAATLAARIIAGDWRVADALIPLVMLAVFPFVEWLVHVGILHWRPWKLGGVTLDPLPARKHLEHHADPRDVPLVFIRWQALLWLLLASIAIALLAFPRLGLTFLVGVNALGFGYEWTHYLLHSDDRPRSRAYRAIWRNHRLHHYKNEHYWFTVTSAGIADRFLGTYPDPQHVESSPTARNLHARKAA
jgi:Fatty acid hydroxylase